MTVPPHREEMTFQGQRAGTEGGRRMACTRAIPLAVLMVVAAGLACATAPERAPRIVPASTAEENISLGKAKLKDRDPASARQYFEAASNLDARNQEARLYLATANVYLGEKAAALKEFQAVLEMGKNTGFANTAREWMARMDSPLEVSARLPAKVEGTRVSEATRRQMAEMGTELIPRRGFFRFVPIRDSEIQTLRRGTEGLCRAARASGAKVILYVVDVRLMIYPGPFSKPIASAWEVVDRRPLAVSASSNSMLLKASDCTRAGSFATTAKTVLAATGEEAAIAGLRMLFDKMAVDLIQETY